MNDLFASPKDAPRYVRILGEVAHSTKLLEQTSFTPACYARLRALVGELEGMRDAIEQRMPGDVYRTWADPHERHNVIYHIQRLGGMPPAILAAGRAGAVNAVDHWLALHRVLEGLYALKSQLRYWLPDPSVLDGHAPLQLIEERRAQLTGAAAALHAMLKEDYGQGSPAERRSEHKLLRPDPREELLQSTRPWL